VVRRLRDIASAREQAEPAAALADAIRESAERIWLAGLGAFAGARRDPGGAFEGLIRDGLALQARSRAAADERLQAARRDLSGRTAQSWDRLEKVFEQRIAAALERIGVPSSAQLKALAQRIDALAAAVRDLEAARQPSPPAPARKKAADGGRAAAARPPVPRTPRSAKPRAAAAKPAPPQGVGKVARKTPRR
jgi:poly(hydroxyalkanoate) granule-associated protein